MNNSYTFLKLNQIYVYEGEKDKRLEIIKKYGSQAYATDFAILLGCYVDSKKTVIEDGLIRYFGDWWTSTISLDYESYGHFVSSIRSDGDSDEKFWFYANGIGGRPAISFSEIKDFCLKPMKLKNDVLEVEYGEYPQTVVDKDFSIVLDEVFLAGLMKKTDKVYKTYSWQNENNFAEYEYQGKKYIRIIGDTTRGYEQSIYNWGRDNVEVDKKILSDESVVQDGEVYWVSVEPIKWLIDRKNDVALSKNILFAGVRYGHEAPSIFDKGYDSPPEEKNDYFFKKTRIKRFLDENFAPNIIDNRFLDIKNKIDEVEHNECIKKELLKFYYDNMFNEFFLKLNSLNKKDNLILFMDIILDSDTYYEMDSKLYLMKSAISDYKWGNTKEAFELIKEIDSDIHKERIDGKIVTYPTGCINIVEKPKRIIDRMKYLYSRLDDSFDVEYIDSIHEKASSLNDLINRKNCYMFYGNIKRKVKSIFTKEKINN